MRRGMRYAIESPARTCDHRPLHSPARRAPPENPSVVANRIDDGIRYEFAERPETGDTREVAPGIHWLRMPLPFSLGHINLWLLEEDDGWTIVDTGVFTDVTLGVWERTFGSVMRSIPANRVLATHLHPDHAGCAGWLCARFGVELWMPREEYLLCRVLVADTGRPTPDVGKRFYAAAGFVPEAMDYYQKMFGLFGKYVAPLPEAYRRLKDGDRISIGGRDWEVIVGRGHSPEHACLFCPAEELLISGDQLLPTISSNVSVYPTEPAANPLADWLTSLRSMQSRLPADVLVLPAHGKPFRGAHRRLEVLIDDHLEGLARLEALCREPKRAIDVFPALFRSRIDDRNLIMATGEAIAHLNYLLDRDRLAVDTDDAGVRWYRSRH
jgi:glyoxylase-like metal-dependent hydrolase (beta-lactamase superfamily II)